MGCERSSSTERRELMLLGVGNRPALLLCTQAAVPTPAIAPGESQSKAPVYVPATIFLVTDHLYHLLVKNYMRRDKAEGACYPAQHGVCQGDSWWPGSGQCGQHGGLTSVSYEQECVVAMAVCLLGSGAAASFGCVLGCCM